MGKVMTNWMRQVANGMPYSKAAKSTAKREPCIIRQLRITQCVSAGYVAGGFVGGIVGAVVGGAVASHEISCASRGTREVELD